MDFDTIGTATAELLLRQVSRICGNYAEQHQWTEEEIAAAQQRHPGQADVLFHAFYLMQLTNVNLYCEMLLRAHCRELLERVAAGADTRPGTAVEVLLLTHRASLTAPLTAAAVGLFLRMWKAASLPDPDNHTAALDYYESSVGSEIDELETRARRSEQQVQRIPDPSPECAGEHLGQAVTCRIVGSIPRRAAPAPGIPDAEFASERGPHECPA
ncbi:hypothetical protein IU433_22265 [Nocardia puris]|uniref:hypothetical protein n=1 Tax=Nocardia TaxID=1817 RepID=UPI00068C7442|nr:MULTISPECIES: hypothetical protein [Nocardia]MBF6137244.1 hypothetical protein [Nocardia otitidiscaviarum]MBF6181848.1 hypothetical protein [Nocardia otitidiscaviarum]MBF6216263.1 hypothetical protein [Nocardia puris]MBF6461741.1 hypothetical protein [Nocardia puris]MBF6488141.1 hypothetical protein [Nocardia otitidiscaviarum]